MVSALPWGAPLDYGNLQGMPDDGHRYELIDGTLLVSPAPNGIHQRCAFRLGKLFDGARRPGTEVLLGPFDWLVKQNTVFIPDVMVIRSSDIGAYLASTPVLVVEVLSPSTRSVDLLLKRHAYAKAGAPWYWVIDTVGPSVTVHGLVKGSYQELATATGEGVLTVEAPFPVTLTPSSLVAAG
jgi:Uma2 family endonuclease